MKYLTTKRKLMLLVLILMLGIKTISCDGLNNCDLGGCDIGGCDTGGCDMAGCDLAGELGCEGGGIETLDWGEYPVDEKIYNLAMLRVTDHGFSYLSQNLVPLLDMVLEDGLNIPVPETEILLCQLCPGNCLVPIEIASVSIEPIFPDKLKVTIATYANFEINLPTNCLGCNIRVHSGGVPLVIKTDIFVDTDNDTGMLDLRVDTPQIPYENIHVSVCGMPGWVIDLVKDMLVGVLESMIKTTIQGMIESIKCVGCDEAEGRYCDPHPDGYPVNCVEGVCRIGESAEDECLLMPLGIEAEADLGALIADFMPGLESKIWLSLLAGGSTQVLDGGLEIGLFGGTITPPDAPDVCVEKENYPGNGYQLPRVPVGNMNEHETPPVPYHAGLGVREEFLDQLGYTLNNSGLLCLGLDEKTPEVGAILGPALFAVILNDLKIYAHDINPHQTWVLQLEPGPPTDFAILDSETAYPEDPSAADVALKVMIDDLKLHFYGLTEERQVRLFTLQVDVDVIVGINMNESFLEIVFADNFLTLKDFRFPFSIVGTPPASASSQLEALIGSLLGSMLGGLLNVDPIEIPPFEISPGTNLVLDVQNIAPEDPKGSTGEYHALFAYLGIGFEEARGGKRQVINAKAETTAEIIDSYLPSAEAFIKLNERPWIELDLSGYDIDGGDNLEFSYAINDTNIWTPWSKERRIHIESDRMLLQMKHQIRVRARDTRYHNTIDPTPEVFEFITDMTRPSLRLMRKGDDLNFIGKDNLTAAGRLQYRYQVNGEDWFDWSKEERLDMTQLKDFPATISVEVQDESGLSTVVTRTYEAAKASTAQVITTGEMKSSGSASVDSASGCSASGGIVAWMLALLLLPLALIRRRIAPARVLIGAVSLATLLLAFGCSSDNAGTPCTTNDDCGVGQRCVNDFCEDVTDGDLNSDGDVVIPDGDESDGDEVDGDETPDGDEVDGDELPVEFPCPKDGDCGPCHYCSQRTGMCRLHQCAPECDQLPSCEEADSCSACVIADDPMTEANQCVVPYCESAADCDCRECPAETPALLCVTGACVCDVPCRDCNPDTQTCCVAPDNTWTCDACPGWCEGVQCDPGFAPGSCDPSTDPECIWAAQWSLCGNWDEETCEFVAPGIPGHEPSCGCKEKPPLPIGWHGRYSDMAIFEGEEIWISAYNETYTDLMVGRAKYSQLAGGEIAWTFLDGVPDVPASGGPSGPRDGIKEPGDNVGMHTSIALSADGWPRIAYQDADNGDLVFIYTNGEPAGDVEPDGDVDPGDGDADAEAEVARSGKRDDELGDVNPEYKWYKIVVDQQGDTGYYTDLWLDNLGRPVIAYMMKSNDEGTLSALKIAMADSANPTEAAQFNTATLDSTAIGTPYCPTADTDPCGLLDDTPYGLGHNPTIAFLPNSQEFFVFYYHHTNFEPTQVKNADGEMIEANDNVDYGNLKSASLSGMPDPATLGTGFSLNVVVGTAGSLVNGNVGQFNSFDFLPANDWYSLAFYNETLNALQIIYDFGKGLKLYTVDDGWREDNQGDAYQVRVGADCDIKLLGSGKINIVYQDQTNVSLMVYEQGLDADGPSGDLTLAPIVSMAEGLDRDGNALEYGFAYGFYPKQVMVAGGLYSLVSSYMADMTDEDEKILRLRLDISAPEAR